METTDLETKELIVTFDTLFEILRNEKTKDDLQKLPESYFLDVVDYLSEKQKSLTLENAQQGLFESEEKEKKIHQISNIKKILKEIYERRENKIFNMALNKSRFFDSIIDTSALLALEKVFYEMLIGILDSHRDSILKRILNCKGPQSAETQIIQTLEKSDPDLQDNDEIFKNAKELISKENQKEGLKESTMDDDTLNNSLSNDIIETANKKDEQQSKSMLIRFLVPVPQFIGADMQEYGPYEEEDVSKLPKDIADVLVNKERAEEIIEN